MSNVEFKRIKEKRPWPQIYNNQFALYCVSVEFCIPYNCRQVKVMTSTCTIIRNPSMNS